MLGSVNYSAKEMRMFAHFKMADLAPHIQPVLFYPILASAAFMANDQSPWADSLRRCIKALETGSVYRETPEWDALIQETCEGVRG